MYHTINSTNNVISLSVTSNGEKDSEWLNNEYPGKPRLKPDVKRQLGNSFKTTNGINYEIVVLKSTILPSSLRDINVIQKLAKSYRLANLNKEMVLLLRSKYSNQDLEKMGLNSLIYMTELFYNDFGQLRLFKNGSYNHGDWLSTCGAYESWDNFGGFAFLGSIFSVREITTIYQRLSNAWKNENIHIEII